MLQRVEIEVVGRQGLLLKREFENVADIRGCNFSTFFRELLEDIGLDSVYFVVNATFYTNTKQRSAIIGHFIGENGMLIPISANAFRTLWEVEA